MYYLSSVVLGRGSVEPFFIGPETQTRYVRPLLPEYVEFGFQSNILTTLGIPDFSDSFYLSLHVDRENRIWWCKIKLSDTFTLIQKPSLSH